MTNKVKYTLHIIVSLTKACVNISIKVSVLLIMFTNIWLNEESEMQIKASKRTLS